MVTELCLPILCVIKAITNLRRLFDHQHPDSSTNSNRTVYTSPQMCKKGSLRSVCHSSIQFSFKIKNWKLMSIFYFRYFYHKKYESAKSKILDFFFPVDRILKYNFYFYFNPVNNKKKNETERQCCFSDNVTVCGKSKN